MSSAAPPPPDQPAGNPEKQPEQASSPPTTAATEDASMDTTEDKPETWDDIPEEIMALSTDEILTRIRLIDNDIKVRICALFCGVNLPSV